MLLTIIPHFFVCMVGRAFFRMVRAWPPIFAMLMAFATAVGVWLTISVWLDPNPAREWYLKAIAPCIVIFYGALLTMYFIKRSRGVWDEFCDWAYSVFDRF